MHPELYKFVQKNSIDEYAKISNYDIESIEAVLRNFSEKYKISIQPYGSVEKHPWHGVVAEGIAPFEIALMHEEINDLKRKTEDIKSSLLFISSNFDSLNEKTEITEFVRKFKENINVFDEKFEWVSKAIANKDYQHQELLNLLSNKINLKNQETDISQYVNNDGLNLTLEAFKSIENDEYLIINKSISRSDLQQKKEQESKSIAELKTNYQIAINELNIKLNLRKEQLRAEQSSKAIEVKKLENSLTTVVNLLALKDVSFENVLDIAENLMSICEQFPNDKIRYTATSLAQIETLKGIIYNHHQFQTKNGSVLDYLIVDSFNDIYQLKECCRELQKTSFLRFFSSKYRRAKRHAKSILKSYESDILAQYKLEKIIKFNDNLGEIKNNILSYTTNKQNLASVSLVELIESSKSWCNYFDNLQIIDFKHIDNISFKRKLLSISKSEMTTIVACLSDLIKSSMYSNFKLGKLTNLSIEGISLSIQEEYKILETKSNEDFAEEQVKLAVAYEAEKIRKDLINTSIDKLISFTSLIDFKNDIPLIKIAELKSLLEKIDLLKFKVKSHFLSEVVPKDIKNSEIIFIKMLDFIQKELGLSNKEIISIIDSDINLWMVSALNRISNIEEAFERIKEISLNKSIFSSKFHDTGIHLEKFRDRIVAAINSADKLNGYLDFCYASKELDKYESSLKRFMKFAKGDSAIVEALPEAFRMCLYYTHIKDRAGENSSFFSKPVESIFNEYRRQFQKYDDLLSDAYKVELHNKLLLQTGPSGVATGKRKDYTEMGLIDHQLKLSKPNISTRNLFSRAPESIQKIKPVFLMSPLSVSQLLPSGKLFFDVVIMDEASQMRPEDSLGSIARSNQTIIVGDPKQMPPSNFFNTNDKQEDGDEEDYIDIPEQSVLDLAMNSFKTRQLKWHYRSRNEKLIAFSNRHFYNNSLTIFPKATHNHPSGVEYLNISGVYKDSTNEKEAYAIVDKVVELIQVNPNRSIMIATMNKKQNDLINQILHEREKNDPVLDQYIQKFSGTLEPLIVKNLENIQGDERDCVLISTVYGKDSNGSFFQRFGPINGKSGDRRLNVLFTRAKHYVLVLTSMDPDDIVLSSNEGGAYIFKNYLNYAKTGKLGTEIESFGDRPPDSDFELFVARKIKERLPSLEVVAQVGVAGFFIDLAIRHPQKPGAFLLGIECDGRAYHSSKSARDRDKIRQKILENLGWRIHRIWSTDWFSNEEQEMNKLVIVVEQAISNMSKDSFLEPSVQPNKDDLNKQNTVHSSNTKIPIEVDIKFTSNNIVEQFNPLDKDLKWINNLNHDNIVESLKQEGLHVMDKRSVGGALWILGDVSLNEMMQLLWSKGFHFIFAQNGGKTTNNKPSWYLKEKK